MIACGLGVALFYLQQKQQKVSPLNSFLGAVKCVLSPFAYSTQHSSNLLQMEERIRATQEEGKKTEKMFEMQTQAFNKEREEKENKLKNVVEEKEKLVEVKESAEEIIKHLREKVDQEKEHREFITNWLKEKYAVESGIWHKKWTALLRQIESTRVNIAKVGSLVPHSLLKLMRSLCLSLSLSLSLLQLDKQAFPLVFLRAGREMEQNQQMETLEAEINAWRKGHLQFLTTWDNLCKNVSLELPDLKEQLAAYQAK